MADTPSTDTTRGAHQVQAEARLDSWKQIAAFLKRDVATVRRWEKREGLPVHRHLHEKLGSVYAYPGELDVWVASRRVEGQSQSGPNRHPGVRRPIVWGGIGVALLVAATITWFAARVLAPTPPHAGRETSNTAAYEHYLKGRYFRSQVTAEGLQQAVGHFQQAVVLDPGYALAHAALADAYTLWSNFTIIPSREAYLNAKAAALEAVALDDSLADAHTTLAMASLFHDWDWPAAERAFRRALALDPNDARAHQRYGLGLMWIGRFDEARAEIERARKLNPVDLEIHGNLSLVLYFARKYDAAIVEARRTLEMDPHSYQGHRTIARALLEQGHHAEAIAAFQRAIASGGIRTLHAELGHAYAVAGRTADAHQSLDELTMPAGRQAASPFDRAVIHTGLGDASEALAWLEKSFAERERWMVTLNVAPVFDPLRADPRFADLLGRVGLWQADADRRPDPVSPVSRPD